MTVVRTVAELRSTLATHRRAGATVGFVPTMGALHQGHLELVRRAAADNDVVVLSIFVNPTQFNDPADLAAYPRTEQRDVDAATGGGVHYVFAPAAAEVYPKGFSATVSLDGPLVDGFEGAHRGAGHFHGVTTVVTKLLNMVGPDRAYFGQKDAQQLRVVRALVDDLNLPVQIVGVPTVREPDGLAMSSRNVRLSDRERGCALALSQALSAGLDAFAAGHHSPTTIESAAQAVLGNRGVTIEYLALVDPDTFARPARAALDGDQLIVAAFVGNTRLIDNMVLGQPPRVLTPPA